MQLRDSVVGPSAPLLPLPLSPLSPALLSFAPCTKTPLGTGGPQMPPGHWSCLAAFAFQESHIVKGLPGWWPRAPELALGAAPLGPLGSGGSTLALPWGYMGRMFPNTTCKPTGQTPPHLL